MKPMRPCVTIVALIFSIPSLAQDAKLIEAAKKEGGKVVLYGSLETPVVEAVIAAFRKKTGLNAEYWRASAMSVMNRSINPLYDVGLTTLTGC